MSKRDSYWFRHDSDAGRGLKMRKMSHIYGHWGKGVYWDVIEILRDQKNYQFESDESSLQLLCDLIGCKDEKKFLSWFKDCVRIGLLSIENDFFYCEPLCDNMQYWETKKENGKKGGRPRKQRAKTETITESKPKPKANQKHNRIEHNITVEYYATYKTEIGKQTMWVEQFYMKHKLKPNTLSPLIDDFINHLVLEDKQHKKLSDFKSHFMRWVETMESKDKLGKYKKSKRVGSL